MFRADHTALSVKSLSRSREFYEHLGGRVVSKPSPYFVEMMLGDLRLHLVRTSAEGPTTPVAAPGLNHFCVSVDSFAELERVRDLLNDCPLLEAWSPFAIETSPMLGEGFATHCEERPPRHTLYARDPDGVELEVRCYN